MKGLLIFIIILLLFLIVIILFIKCKNNEIIDRFKKGNCIVYGSKGHGKDILFQWVIRKRANKKESINQLSNIDYGYGTRITNVKEISIGNNTYVNMIEGTITKSDKNFTFEGKDMYLSDSGIYFPCQYDYLLDKEYKSFPIVFATSRHLYNMNFHLNTQALDRVWKKIREQADSYFWCRKCFKIFGWIFVAVRYYELYDSACMRIAPYTSLFLNAYDKSQKNLYDTQHGKINDYLICINKRDIKYDTRIFESIFYGNVNHELNKKQRIDIIKVIKYLRKESKKNENLLSSN